LKLITALDWFAEPPHAGRTIREEGERLRKRLPKIEFDHPKPR
jgi:hypothetical protein